MTQNDRLRLTKAGFHIYRIDLQAKRVKRFRLSGLSGVWFLHGAYDTQKDTRDHMGEILRTDERAISDQRFLRRGGKTMVVKKMKGIDGFWETENKKEADIMLRLMMETNASLRSTLQVKDEVINKLMGDIEELTKENLVLKNNNRIRELSEPEELLPGYANNKPKMRRLDRLIE
ncbi:hypothetical protein ES707_08071 [subsurface metagenome]